MKRILFLSAFSIFGLTVFAQPVIQASDFFPSIGESFTMYESDYLNEGPSGNQVTWDLSGLSILESYPINILAPDPNVPNSTHRMVYQGPAEIHLDLSGNDYIILAEEGDSILFDYSNTKTMYKFPMSMGTSFIDSFAASINVEGMLINRTGSIESVVDGSGTLITPAGTFTNVLRVHTIITSNDAFMGQTVSTVNDMYSWIKAGSHFELASVQEITSIVGASTHAFYVDGTLGLEDNSLIHPLSLYPNPAQEIVTLKFDLQIDKVEVSDQNGRSIEVDFDFTNKTIDISELNSGVYFVTAFTNKSKSIKKLVKR